ncbi:MAG: RIO1 family regulatory kinase/ATPase [Candidatus Bathyarchaeia archaeon]
MGELVSLERLREERYARVICYPRYSPGELTRRVGEMGRLNVGAVEFVGEKTVCDLQVLGKGCVSVVVLARTGFGKAALKIRRTDADRSSMKHESEMLRMANSVSVGPRLIGFTENLLLMELIDGMLLPNWIGKIEGADAEIRIRRVLRDVMEQSRRLDTLGLDHGELSRASKHIIVSPEGKAYILDFESASINRRTSNVTSICQYLFLRSEVAQMVKENLGKIREDDLIKALRIYKSNPSRENFEKVLGVCRLGELLNLSDLAV